MIALICAVASGIDRLMADTGERITPWMAPHFFDNVYFVTFYGFIVCYMYSDVPFMLATRGVALSTIISVISIPIISTLMNI